MQFKNKATGIDLGTTNSAVAILNPSDSEIVLHRDPNTHSKTTPSCLWKNPRPRDGEDPYVVGVRAAGRVGSVPEPIRSIKSKMGKQCTVRVTDEDMTPEQVSSFYLKELKNQIETDVAGFNTEQVNWFVDRAIVTVPAYFDQPAIDATRKAAEMAGLELVELLAEPTAAARFHCWRTNTMNGTFMIYDFGGGTFDVSILRVTEGRPEELGIKGNNRLGGDDIDDAIARHICECLNDQGWALDLDPANDPEDRLRFILLKAMAEKTKKALSDSTTYILRDELKDKNGDRVLVEIPFERPPKPDWQNLSPIEQIIFNQAKRTIPYCHQAIEIAKQTANITAANLDGIILAGGSTHIPLVREIVRNEFCAEPDAEYNQLVEIGDRMPQPEPVYEEVDTIVARGAAIQAAAAGGLHVYNENRTTRICLSGTGLTAQTEGEGEEEIALSNVGMVVEKLSENESVGESPSWKPLSGGSVEVGGLDCEEDEKEINKHGIVTFEDIEVRADAMSLLEFKVYDKSGNLIAVADREITPGDQEPDPVTTATLAKALNLEVNADGQLTLEELIPQMSSLPREEEFEFQHPGTRRVLFPVYQNRKKIQVIKVDVPDMPAGEPVNLKVSVDKLSFITVKGVIGSKSFEAAIEPPPPRAFPSEDEIASLKKRFEAALQFLAPGDRMAPQLRWINALKGFEDARTAKNDDLAIHNFEEMEAIVDEIERPAVVLEPPKEKFDKLVANCLELNQECVKECEKKGIPHDVEETKKNIFAQRDQGEAAHAEGNQVAYAEAFEMLRGILRHLLDNFDPPTDEEKAVASLRHIQEEATVLIPMANAAGKREFANEMTEMTHQLPQLMGQIQSDVDEVLRRAAMMVGRLHQIRSEVTRSEGPVDRPPGLDELVRKYSKN